MKRDTGIDARFWAKVDRAGPTDCWNWTAAMRDNGYGQISISGRPQKAHRVAFFIHNGYLPEVVRHTCDNPPCVNPGHLLGGTQADNINDAMSRGRTVRPPIHPGVSNSQSKLTDDLVRDARARHAGGESLRSLARAFGVDRKTITQAVRGEHWAHV